MFTINLVGINESGNEVEHFYTARRFELEHRDDDGTAVLIAYGLSNPNDDAYIPIGFAETTDKDANVGGPSMVYRKLFVMNEAGKTVTTFFTRIQESR